MIAAAPAFAVAAAAATSVVANEALLCVLWQQMAFLYTNCKAYCTLHTVVAAVAAAVAAATASVVTAASCKS
jgi:hypothetical protein